VRSNATAGGLLLSRRAFTFLRGCSIVATFSPQLSSQAARLR